MLRNKRRAAAEVLIPVRRLFIQRSAQLIHDAYRDGCRASTKGLFELPDDYCNGVVDCRLPGRSLRCTNWPQRLQELRQAEHHGATPTTTAPTPTH
jgi:hypothetical protein